LALKMHKAIKNLYTDKKELENKVSSKARASRWIRGCLEALMLRDNEEKKVKAPTEEDSSSVRERGKAALSGFVERIEEADLSQP